MQRLVEAFSKGQKNIFFKLRLVTVDETWIHYPKPENTAQSRQWVGLDPRGQRSSRHNHLLAR